MTDDSYVFEGPAEAPPPRDNNPPLSISELSFALKRTLEDRFGHVRLRGEVSKVNRHASGHVYLTLKDDKSALDGVIWKGSVRGLGVQPETGLEVIVTGKITSYPARSSYQIVIESMEAAGAGALLAQLERLKARLREEGLFEPSRKRPLPVYPAVIGVITSPTGAVIRDILHRLAERWPCQVIVWPCVVQGDAAARQVAAAVRGFDALAPDGPIPRPDVVIVARGGGSVEDLWPFNDEALARTVAEARIPIISAVGHETDTTLIDFVSDRRAPTPTGAAEMATPVLAELQGWLADAQGRLARAGGRLIEDRRTRLRAVARGLPGRPTDLTALAQQRLDHAASRLTSGLRENTAAHERRMVRTTGRLRRGLLDQLTSQARLALRHASSNLGGALRSSTAIHAMNLQAVSKRFEPRLVDLSKERLSDRLQSAATRFAPLAQRRLDQDRTRLNALARALATLDPSRPKPGFARVDDAEGRMIASAAQLSPGQAVRLVFADGDRGAHIDGDADTPPRAATPRPAARPKPPSAGQGDLF